MNCILNSSLALSVFTLLATSNLYAGFQGQVDCVSYSEPASIEESFQARLSLKEKLIELESKNELTSDCVDAMRRATRSFRYYEDYAIEKIMLPSGRGPDDYTTFVGEFPYLIVNPKFSSFSGVRDLRSGDVIISRGNAYSSAAIARMGKEPMQFSHISFVYVDDKGQIHTTEAHIEIGVVAAPILAHINEKNARTAIYRFHDPILAHLAAKIMYERASAQSARGSNIPYDFAMNYRDNREIFCSEVVYLGFNLASQGEVDIPFYKTTFPKGRLPFLNIVGVPVNSSTIEHFNTFMPGDLEYDSRFELVAEWRNPAKLEDSRFKDVIMSKVFEWMSERHYRFDPNMAMHLKAGTGWVARRLPFLREQFKDKFPLNMHIKQIQLFLVLDVIGENLQKQLDQAQASSDHQLSLDELSGVLENYREKNDPALTKWFRPRYQIRGLVAPSKE